MTKKDKRQMFHEFATVKMFLQLYEMEKVVDKHVRFNRIHLKKKKKQSS